MPRGFMLYVSAAAVGLLGFGQPVPAEATDTSQMSAMTTAVPDTTAAAAATAASAASDTAAAIASSIGSSSSTSVSSSATSISVTVTPSSSSTSTPTTAPSSSYTASSSITISFDTETCQSKTINYITHTLPQQCLRTSWSSANATATTTETVSGQAEAPPSETAAAAEATPEGEAKETEKEKGKDDDSQEEDLATDSFMSFEEWKVLQLKKAGQDPAELQARRRQQQQQQQQQHHAGQHAHGAGGDINIDSIGDDGEIALDFDVLNEKVSEMAGSASGHAPSQYHDGSGGGGYRQDGSSTDSGNGAPGGSSSGLHDEAVVYADGATQYYRSKDAGKTGKERFSFASFDAGATVLKANKGVKNAKAILVENKDSYMLLECRTRDKHVIVELSDDILVDTVVLANFEFFSSMVRRFRVSVSDRYPVKADRWRTLGEYEARNSRDIQPFLIEHPQIWAKYIRIDFLTHYGSEYYCPISLLRVHGTRMLDSWKDSENGRDGEDDEELEHHQQYEQQQQQQQQYEQQKIEQEQQQRKQEEEQAQAQADAEASAVAAAIANDKATKVMADANAFDPVGYTPWNPIAAYLRLFIADAVCLPTSASTGYASGSKSNADGPTGSESSQQKQGSMPSDERADNGSKPSQAAESASASSAQPPENASTPTHTQSGAKDTPVSDSSSSSSASSNASSSSDAAQPSQASDSATSSSATAAKVQEQDAAGAAAAAAIAKQKSGSAGNQQTPPPTTVQASHAKNRASSGGAGGAGSSSQSGSSLSGSTGGSGSNPGATPQNSGPSTSGGNNNNNNGVPAGGAPSPPPPPIVQESFFKSITKRLQLLESNTSLSLQYIEDQSRFLQEALRKMERKQISRVDSFLDTLNNTVLSELRNMRQQYDQIWQSTVIALETQREQNQRETVALSDRLNVLADEVVFQKRMAILQSVLLLCCLALVIFSRGLLSSGSASVPLDVNAATAAAMAAAAGYMPAGSAMSPSPSSPPSASSSVGLRSNLRSLRNNLRNPYAAYSVYASGYPLSAYSAGSPPPPSNLRAQTMPVNGSASSIPAPINKNKVLPLTPTTPTSPTSPGSPVSPEPTPSNESQDSLLSVDDQEPQVLQDKGPGPVLVEPKPLTPPASLRLSDIEEAADQLEDDEEEEDSSEDHDDETVLSEATTVHPDRISGGDDNTNLFTPTAATPTKVDPTENGLLSSPTTTPFLPNTSSTETSQDLPLSHKRLPSLPEHNSN
ncbi:hypothetical protein Sste5346_002882 [Sporothrix stenoceras]|uniref:SUN domain-containing protein n=1 Tax=Sporothrix stenoceras TaxID=5173 RepID=A0ABR3ZFL8_9PEZI